MIFNIFLKARSQAPMCTKSSLILEIFFLFKLFFV
jgi:hypothetical protein